MIDSRSKLLNWFFVLSLILFILMILAMVIWAVFFNGWHWVVYWVQQILK